MEQQIEGEELQLSQSKGNMIAGTVGYCVGNLKSVYSKTIVMIPNIF